MDPQLKATLQQTVKIASSTSKNNYGERTYGSAASHKVRITGRQRIMRNSDGQEVLSNHQLVMSSSYVPKITDVVWLPDQTTSQSPWFVAAVSERVDEKGSTDYYKVYLGGVRTQQ